MYEFKCVDLMAINLRIFRRHNYCSIITTTTTTGALSESLRIYALSSRTYHFLNFDVAGGLRARVQIIFEIFLGRHRSQSTANYSA